MGRSRMAGPRIWAVALLVAAVAIVAIDAEQAYQGRRGGAFLSTMGSFTLSGGNNRAGNGERQDDVEDLGSVLDDASDKEPSPHLKDGTQNRLGDDLGADSKVAATGLTCNEAHSAV